MRTLRILLADDHPLVRGGIRALLKEIEGVTIVAEAANGREAVALARTHAPNLVIMDISMKELNGIEATAQIKAEMPEARILVLSMHATEEFVHRALKAGASGYLVKDSASLDTLTPRQREILQMIAEGKSTKEIAFALHLSVKTVETHRAALMDRLGIHDVPGLVLYAVRHRLVSADHPED